MKLLRVGMSYILLHWSRFRSSAEAEYRSMASASADQPWISFFFFFFCLPNYIKTSLLQELIRWDNTPGSGQAPVVSTAPSDPYFSMWPRPD